MQARLRWHSIGARASTKPYCLDLRWIGRARDLSALPGSYGVGRNRCPPPRRSCRKPWHGKRPCCSHLRRLSELKQLAWSAPAEEGTHLVD